MGEANPVGSSHLARGSQTRGLIFDAESNAIIGKFSDELAAYRARRNWIGILAEDFLLEKQRDYEMSVIAASQGTFYLLACSFTSACGRYAFWRLVNRQAQESERRLTGGAPPRRRATGSFLSALSLWSSGPEVHKSSPSRNCDCSSATGFWGRLQKMFN